MLLASWTLPITNCGGHRAVAELLQPHALCLSCLELQVWGLSLCWSPQWLLPRRHVLVKYQTGAVRWLLANSPDSRGVSVDLTRVLQLTSLHPSPHVLEPLVKFLCIRQFVQRLWCKMCAFTWDVFSSSLCLFLPWLDKNYVCF